jgi:hypothetical protein
MGQVTTRNSSMARRLVSILSLTAAVTWGVSGCVDPGTQLATTPPVDDFVLETPPLTEEELEEDAVADDVVFGSIEECLQGNWEVDNGGFAQFFVATDDRVQEIDVTGLATMTIENDTYRMFFTEWNIQFDTSDPTFLISRSGNETVQFLVDDAGVLTVVERDDQVTVEEFNIVRGGDGDAIPIASSRQGPLPLEGAGLQCTGTTLEVSVESDSFVFNRR